jgi:hypothetical protein
MDEQETRALLDAHYAQWSEDLTNDQRFSLLDWQTERHRMFNELMRSAEVHGQKKVVESLAARFGEDEIEYLLASVGPLQEACSIEVTPADLTVWRGVDRVGYQKILERLGGVSRLAPGDEIWDAGFLATSVRQSIAETLMRDYQGDSLLLKLEVKAGSPAAWLPAAIGQGDQAELLFAPPTWAVVRSVRKLGKDHGADADLELD